MIFGAFERLVALRYLRARRQEGFISVIAIFSLLGIALGVATLIIVMAVMNGFRQELMGRILGVNGHLTIYAASRWLDYDALTNRLRKLDDVTGVAAGPGPGHGQPRAAPGAGAWPRPRIRKTFGPFDRADNIQSGSPWTTFAARTWS